jgi:hypothetical protein
MSYILGLCSLINDINFSILGLCSLINDINFSMLSWIILHARKLATFLCHNLCLCSSFTGCSSKRRKRDLPFLLSYGSLSCGPIDGLL